MADSSPSGGDVRCTHGDTGAPRIVARDPGADQVEAGRVPHAVADPPAPLDALLDEGLDAGAEESTAASRSSGVAARLMPATDMSECDTTGLIMQGSAGHSPSGPSGPTVIVPGCSTPTARAVRASSRLSQSARYCASSGPTDRAAQVGPALGQQAHDVLVDRQHHVDGLAATDLLQASEERLGVRARRRVAQRPGHHLGEPCGALRVGPPRGCPACASDRHAWTPARYPVHSTSTWSLRHRTWGAAPVARARG